MAVPNRRLGRSRFTLALLVLTSVTLLTLDFRGFGPLETAQDNVLSAFSPVIDGADGVFEPVTGVWDRLVNYDELEQENDELRAQVEELRGQAITGFYAERTLNQLSSELDVDQLSDIPTQLAKVVGTGVGNFDPFVLEIDKGTSSGVKDGMPVVSNGGLIGQISEAGTRRSRVQLITDPEFQVGVLLVRADELAIASGSEDGEAVVVDQGFDAKVEVEAGEVLVTSGVRGSRYPAGIPVGAITEIDVDQGALEKNLTVELAADPEALAFVTVVLYDPDAAAEGLEPAPEQAE